MTNSQVAAAVHILVYEHAYMNHTGVSKIEQVPGEVCVVCVVIVPPFYYDECDMRAQKVRKDVVRNDSETGLGSGPVETRHACLHILENKIKEVKNSSTQ